MTLRKPASLLAAALLVLGGCSLFSAWDDQRPADGSIRLANDTSHELVVTALTEDALAVSFLAAEMRRDQLGGRPLEPGRTQTLRFDDIAGDFGRGVTTVFVLYAALPSQNLFRVARSLSLTYGELAERDFQIEIRPEDLTFEHYFGDPYRLVTQRDAVAQDLHPPRIQNGHLEAWVSFGGCEDPTFALRQHHIEEGLALSIYHDYPDVEVDCERLNHRALRFELGQDVLREDRILLLNPNSGGDPFTHAFVLRGR